MLDLKIENFGIIEDLRMRAGQGLHIITGETGAGKSLLLQSLEAVMGGRMGSGVVRNGASRAMVEATFDITSNPELRQEAELREQGGEDFLILKREISLDGRSRAYVNGKPVRLQMLRDISSHLIEIHGQHENQRLLDPESHLESLDLFGDLLPLRNRVSELYQKYTQLKKRLRSVTLEEGEKQRRLDYLHYALGEIDDFAPRESEYEEIEQLRAIFQNSGKLFRDLMTAYSHLREEEGSILDRLGNVEVLLENHGQLHPALNERLEDIREATCRLELVADTMRSERERLQFSPEQLEDLEDRIAGYRKLFKKYGGNARSVLELQADFQRELRTIEMSDEEARLLLSEMEVIYEELLQKSRELSHRRRGVVSLLEDRLAYELAELGMSGARITISLTNELEGDPVHNLSDVVSDRGENGVTIATPANGVGERYRITEKGMDSVEFLLCANQGERLQPLRRVASGGELSRIMLALKSIIMEGHPVGTVIFDEVDSGVGGEVAHAIASRLKAISGRSQVLVVTHLHQIAGNADLHFRIFKQLRAGRTVTHLQRLHGEQRLKELARMLGGEASGAAVIEHAKELLRNGEKSPVAVA